MRNSLSTILPYFALRLSYIYLTNSWLRNSRAFLVLLAAMTPAAISVAQSAPETKISLPLPPHVSRADLYIATIPDKPRAVLVICPGLNVNGGDWIMQPAWQSFARSQHLGLAGISFASDPDDWMHGYHFVRNGSGQALVDGLRKAYGGDLPLLMYGFSRGAVFVSRFADWKPERLLGWCAYSPGEGDEQSPHRNAPPGLIACGEDDSNYGFALSYFKRGRAQGKPWLWLSLANTGHTRTQAEEDFVRTYLAGILADSKTPVWVDIDEKRPLTSAVAAQTPSESGLIPDSSIVQAWTRIHEP